VLLCSNVRFPEWTSFVVNFWILGHLLELLYNFCVLLVLFFVFTQANKWFDLIWMYFFSLISYICARMWWCYNVEVLLYFQTWIQGECRYPAKNRNKSKWSVCVGLTWRWFFSVIIVYFWWRSGWTVGCWTCDHQVMGSILTVGSCEATLGKLFTPMCLCHQSV